MEPGVDRLTCRSYLQLKARRSSRGRWTDRQLLPRHQLRRGLVARHAAAPPARMNGSAERRALEAFLLFQSRPRPQWRGVQLKGTPPLPPHGGQGPNEQKAQFAGPRHHRSTPPGSDHSHPAYGPYRGRVGQLASEGKGHASPTQLARPLSTPSSAQVVLLSGLRSVKGSSDPK
jgi:hypothetical protein